MEASADSPMLLVGVAYKRPTGAAATPGAAGTARRPDDRVSAYTRATYVYDTSVKPPALVEILHDTLPHGMTNEAGLWKDALVLADAGACRGSVNVDYLYDPSGGGAWRDMGLTRSQALDSVHSSVCVAYTRARRGRGYVTQAQGFLVGQDDEEGAYVDVICSNAGFGATLLETFIAFVRAHQRRAAITLSALPTVLSYYPRFGFAFRASCAEPPVEFGADLRAQLLALVKARAFPSTLDDAYANPVTALAMRILQEHGLNVRKRGKCGDTHASLSDIRDDSCGNDGYTMKLCPFDDGASPVAPLRHAAPLHAPSVVAAAHKGPKGPKGPKALTSPTKGKAAVTVKSPTKGKAAVTVKSPSKGTAAVKPPKPKTARAIAIAASLVTSPRRSPRSAARRRVDYSK